MLKYGKIFTILKSKARFLLFCVICILYLLSQIYNLRSCCVTKILVPSGIHSEGCWAHAGPDALQRVFKIFQLDIAHLSDESQIN